MKCILLLVLALGLVAAEPLTIVAFGDSTTAPRPGNVEQVYADRLAPQLAARGISAVVHNAGVGGSHSGHLRDNGHHQRQHARDRLDDAVRSHDPDVVVVQFGINDSWVDNIKVPAKRRRARIPLYSYRRNLTSIITTLRADGARVILMTPNQLAGDFAAWRNERLAGYAEVVRQVAARHDLACIDVWAAYEQRRQAGGVAALAALLLDGCHPNDDGHALLAELLAAEIASPARLGATPPPPGIDPAALAATGISTTALFTSGDDGVSEYRIPSLITTTAGTLLAVCDARVDRPGDVPNNVDLVVKRSSDGGVSWSEQAVAIDFPGVEGAADPSLVQDRESGAIFVAYVYCPGRSDDPDLAPRLSGRRIMAVHLLRSDDDGVTWSQPIDIQPQLQPDGELVVCWPGPGRGIQTRAGRLIIPVSEWTGSGYLSRLVVSDDHGVSWAFAGTGVAEVNEPTVAEAGDGSLLMVARNGNRGRRGVARSTDGGLSWSAVGEPAELVAPNCQGSLLVYSARADGAERDVWLHATPGDPAARRQLTVRVSFDEGHTWPISRVLDPGGAAYTCLTRLDDGSIG
ncbi:MAG: DUF459 domain-containing protein, partial [Planctomycetota bacterium]